MFDRKTIIAMVLVGLVLLLLPKYYELVSPKKPAGQDYPSVKKPVSTDTVTAAPPPVPVTAPAEAVAAQTEGTTLGTDSIPINPELVSIETPLFQMTIGSNAQASRYTLKKYNIKPNSLIQLHLARQEHRPTVGAVDFDFGRDNFKSIKNISFRATKTSLNVSSGADSVTFSAVDSSGRSVLLTYIFDAERYGFVVALRTSGLRTPEIGEYKIHWLGGVPITEMDSVRDLQYAGSYAMVGEDIEKMTVGGDRKKEFNATGQTHFVAARSKYFMAALIPDEPAAGAELLGRNDAPKQKSSPHYYDLTLRQSWGTQAQGRWTVYWGPMKFDNLKALNVGLEETMNWGWQIIKPFSRLVLWALIGLHDYIPNYGIVILIFSVLIKLVLWPLTRKSQISMKKMAALQPEIKNLRELHSKNSQAMNQAIMALYKERGVNPMSGCIPLLLQMPLLYALFIIFSSTIEFRQAPFILWIKDLSQPDFVAQLPFNIPMYGAAVAVLPLIMAITQFFMSKRTVTDPNQKFMLYFMPVFMLMIFNNLPSGLTFYYTLFNLLAIVEQQMIKVPDFTPSVEVVEEKRKGWRKK
ncbi:membrane protein insertase YidC [candidate division KSB1 bacterium]|nr:MAG: membrane protein insertase YidC [candidate division KSB1 bacterium]